MSFIQANPNGGGLKPFIEITGTPNRFALFDNLGKGATDDLATRDYLTGETYIGYRTGAGQFTNAMKLGNFIGTLIPDGVGFERHDAVGDNFTFSAAIDGTSVGSSTNSLLQGYADITNGIFVITTLNAFSSDMSYANDVAGVYGDIVIGATKLELLYTDNNTTFQTNTQYSSTGIRNTFQDILTGREMTSLITPTGVRFGNVSGSFGNHIQLDIDDFNQEISANGLYSSFLNVYGKMLSLNANSRLMGMGDVDKILSHAGFFVDTVNGISVIDGLQTPFIKATPSHITAGFSGTGLNDMQYDSYTTYSNSLPNTYTATISHVDAVYMSLTMISTPGFAIGDTVTDGAGSTGTIIKGGDVDGFIVVEPIIDLGWTSATAVADTTSGAAATVSGVIYTDTFDWGSSQAGVGSAANVPCSSFINLGYGMIVKFGAQTGHTIGDSWKWTLSTGYAYSKIAKFDGRNGIVKLGDVDTLSNGAIISVDVPNNKINLKATTINVDGLPAFADDAAASSLAAGDLYQTTGAGAAPLNVAGIVMVKQ